jgi:polysaccharide pyruvyl transferase WcaK-like protein
MDNIYVRHVPPTDQRQIAGLPIWQRLFPVSVAYRDTMSVDYMRLFGMPTVGDAGLDSAMHTDAVDSYITIDRMVMYFKEGIAVRLRCHTDTKVIYDILTEYLNGWKDSLRSGINVGGAPIDDLVLMDRFAATVFPHASHHFKEEDSFSNVVKGLMGGGGYSRHSLMGHQDPSDVSPAAPRQHVSLTELFSQSMKDKGGGRWK